MLGVNAVPLLYPKSAHPISSASRNKKLGIDGLEFIGLKIPAMAFTLMSFKVSMQVLLRVQDVGRKQQDPFILILLMTFEEQHETS